MNLNAPAWLVAWLQSITVWDLVLIGAAVSAVVVFIRKKGWRWVKSFAQAILKTADVIEHVGALPDLARQVADIHHETQTNDGSSIKDAVNRLEVSVSGLHARMDKVERDAAAAATAKNQENPND